MAEIGQLKVQNMDTPVGVCTRKPVFSYCLISSEHEKGEKEILQGAYRILVSSEPQRLEQDQGDLWDSGIVKSSSVSGIVYEGKMPGARQRLWWKVKVWNQKGEELGWSEKACWETGLFPEDWQAEWIGQGDDFAGNKAAAPMFVCDFQASLEGMSQARLYISGLGVYRASINGKALADTLFDPGECDRAAHSRWGAGRSGFLHTELE